ncbi:MAG: DNA polymerase II [Nanoarchaeota archaeon]
MKGFVVYATYRVENDKAKVYLFGRLENGDSFCAIKSFKPYFFIKDSQTDVFKLINTGIKFEVQASDFTNFKGEKLAKIVLNNPKEVPSLRDQLLSKGVECYEADIRFAYRFLFDHDIKGGIEIEGEFKQSSLVSRIYDEPQISGAEVNVPLKVLSIDIETDRNAQKIFSIALYSEALKHAYVVSDKEVEGAKAFPDESALLSHVLEAIRLLDPDIIVGWNIVDFDFKVLQDRCRKLGVPFSISRDEKMPVYVKIKSEFMRDSEAEVPGRIVFDGIQLLKASFVKLEDYKLDTAAKELLGEAKAIAFTNKREEIELLYKNAPAELCKYNLKDADLVYRILVEKGFIDLAVARTKLTGMLPDRIKASVASLDSLYLRETRLRKIACMTTKVADRGERIKGGFVMESKPGIYGFVSVFDFKSLYPSIIRTFNIDPLSNSPDGEITAPNGAKFRNNNGILPVIIERLWEQRELAKQRNNNIESQAIKITMNSFFGVLANPACRFYSLDVANAITSFGQTIIKKTAELLRQEGLDVIYGDTDSIFISLDLPSFDEAQKVSSAVVGKVNSYYDAYVRDNFGRKSCMELQYEKTFIRFLMPKIRDSEVGSKKRYAGMIMKDGKEKIVFTGLEFVRRDWTEAAKKFQMHLIELLFHQKDLKSYIRSYVQDITSGKLDNLLVYRKALRKDVSEYTKTTPPHVKAARQLQTIDNPIISYYQTVDGPQPLELIKSKIDYEHYIEKQIKPIAEAVLGFYGESFDEIISNSKQHTLFSF